jgi:hypothetical protein
MELFVDGGGGESNQTFAQELLEIARGYRAAQAVAVVAKLGIADLLADRPQHVGELAVAAGAHAPSLYRLLRAVASFGVFAEDDDGRFHMTPLAEPLRSDIPGSVRDFVSFYGEPFLWEPWGHLLHSVRTGETGLRHLYGLDLFGYLALHPEATQVFQAGLAAAAPDHEAVVAAYDFAPLDTVVDVGGGHGALLVAVLQKYPSARGILFDQPEIVTLARPQFEAVGITDRCEFVTGDFFERVPAGGEGYLLSMILHDWDDERAEAILINCRLAMPADGRLLVIERIVPPGNGSSQSKLSDLNMLVVTGGRERTEAEYRALFAAAGFRLTRVIPTQASFSVLEGVVASPPHA